MKPKHSALALLASVITAAAIVGCSTAQQDKISAIFNSPANQAVLQVVGNVVLNSALACAESAANQYVSTSSVSGKSIEHAAITGGFNSVAFQLRTLQSTPQASSPQAIAQAFAFSGLAPAATAQVAPTVATAVAGAVAQGVSPDKANEAAAVALDAAAQQAAK
jgi:hypothetical protein